jgi:hypothetical protein
VKQNNKYYEEVGVMNPEQVQYLFATHGYENLIFISLNNNRRFHIDDEMRSIMTWDHVRGLLTFPQEGYVLHEMRDFQPRNVVISQDYSMLESFIFATDVKSRLTGPNPANK